MHMCMLSVCSVSQMPFQKYTVRGYHLSGGGGGGGGVVSFLDPLTPAQTETTVNRLHAVDA